MTDPETTSAPRSKKRYRRLILVLVFGILCLFAGVSSRGRTELAMLMGRYQLNHNQAAKAVESFEKAVQLSPELADGWILLARSYRRVGQNSNVRKSILEGQKHCPREFDRFQREWWLSRAELGYILEAEPHLARMLVEPGDDATEICEAFATGFCLNLRFNSALILLETWHQDDPSDFRPLFRKGQVLYGTDDFQPAVDAYRAALMLSPDNAEIQRELGRALVQLGRREEAEPLLTAALEKQPENKTIILTLAELCKENQDYEQGIRLLKRILELDPTSFVARLNLCRQLLAAGNAKEAVRTAEQLHDEWPEDLATVYALAQALRASGQHKEAEQYFLQYQSLNGILAELEQLKNEVNSRSNDAEIRFRIGELMLKHVNRDEGIAWLRSVLFLQPNHEGAIALLQKTQKVGGRKP